VDSVCSLSMYTNALFMNVHLINLHFSMYEKLISLYLVCAMNFWYIENMPGYVYVSNTTLHPTFTSVWCESLPVGLMFVSHFVFLSLILYALFLF
jgi:hypothetical protein